jgi:hypothetical protein
MPIPIEKNVELIDNKVQTMEVVLMSLIQAVDIVARGAAKETVGLVRAQAGAARDRGDKLGFVLLTSAAEQIGRLCDLPGSDNPEG